MRARGLRPRGVRIPLALARYTVLPSVLVDAVGTPDYQSFAAPYPARMFPCQRFAGLLADTHA